MGEQRVEWNKTSSVAAKISNFFTPTLRSRSAFRVFLQTRYTVLETARLEIPALWPSVEMKSP